MTNLHAAKFRDNTLRDELLRHYPELAEDEAALLDTLDSISDLDMQLAAVMRQAIEREEMAASIGRLMNDMLERSKRLVIGAHKLRAAVLTTMQETGRRKIGGTVAIPDMTISVRNGKPKTHILDEDALPDEFCTFKRRPDLLKINRHLADGNRPDWATLGNGADYLAVNRK